MVIYASPYEMYFNAESSPNPRVQGPRVSRERVVADPGRAEQRRDSEITYTPRQFHVDPSRWKARPWVRGNAETYRIFVHPNRAALGFHHGLRAGSRHALQVNNKIRAPRKILPGLQHRQPGGEHAGDEQNCVRRRWDNGGDAFAYPNGERQKPLFMYWGTGISTP